MKTTLLLFYSLLAFNICNSQQISKEDAEKKKQEVKDQIESLKIQKRTAALQAQLDSQENQYVLQPNESVNYSANVLTSNFSIPLARFNFTGSSNETPAADGSSKPKNGEIVLFNSIGAGVSFNHGIYTATTNGNSEVVNHEFVNIIGVQAGFLFSAGTGEDTKNVFAPVVNIVALDFQLGFGWELGTINQNQKRGFLTLSYAIPMYKLSRTGFYILNKRFKDKAKPIKTDATPQQGVSQSGAATGQAAQKATEASVAADAKAKEAEAAKIKADADVEKAKKIAETQSDEVIKIGDELSSYKSKHNLDPEIENDENMYKSSSVEQQKILDNFYKLDSNLKTAVNKLDQANENLNEARVNAITKYELYKLAKDNANVKAKAKADAATKAKLVTDPNTEPKPNTTAPAKTNPNSSGFLKL